MAVYDLEEQEKIDDLKAFWNRWGNAILAAVIAVCLAYVAVAGWRWWTNRQAEEAARRLKDKVTEKTQEGLDRSRDYIRENPMRTVLCAAAVGVVVGILIARRS